MNIENRCGRISAKAAGAGLVAHGCNRHLTLDIELALYQMIFEIELVQQTRQPAVEALGRRLVVRGVIEGDLALLVDRHPVLWGR